MDSRGFCQGDAEKGNQITAGAAYDAPLKAVIATEPMLFGVLQEIRTNMPPPKKQWITFSGSANDEHDAKWYQSDVMVEHSDDTRSCQQCRDGHGCDIDAASTLTANADKTPQKKTL